ncbi:hypothetical protein BT96DRAFT_816539, partial [Gymnopus androsaceus JB14]
DREIQILESRRLVFARKQEHVRKGMAHLQTLLLPFRKIPDEILQRIFEDCCDGSDNRFILRKTAESLWILSEICLCCL